MANKNFAVKNGLDVANGFLVANTTTLNVSNGFLTANTTTLRVGNNVSCNSTVLSTSSITVNNQIFLNQWSGINPNTVQGTLGFTPLQQGTGTSQFANTVKIGWSASSQLRLMVDTTDYGVTWPIAISGLAGSVAWTTVTGRPTNVSAFTNDTGFITSSALTPYFQISGGTFTGAVYSKAVNQSATNPANNGFVVQNANGSGAEAMSSMGFLSNPAYGINVGLRADGVFAIGGWSRPAYSWYTDASGNMVAAGNITGYSDPRLKKNFKRIPNALEILSRLTGGSFNWKKGIKHTACKQGKKDYGVLADEVEAVMPEIISESVSIDDVKYKMVAYEKIIPVLIEAIKDLSKKVDKLEGKV